MESILDEISEYERERGKPMPNLTHAIIQSNLVFELRSRYGQQYRALSELTLDTPPNGSTPDVVVYPFFEASFSSEYPARRTDAPLITVEIQSPSQSLDEMVDKAIIYFAFGVKSCWIIQPRIEGVFVFRQPDQYEFFHHDDTLIDPVTGLELELKKVFS